MCHSSVNSLCSTTCTQLQPDSLERTLESTSPHHTVGDETQGEDGQTRAQQHLLYYLQHLDTGDELLLKHVCRFVIQRSRLVHPNDWENSIILDFLKHRDDLRWSVHHIHLNSFSEPQGKPGCRFHVYEGFMVLLAGIQPKYGL